MVTIALSVSYALEKPWKFLKNETQKFYAGGLGGFCPGGFCRGVYVRGFFVLEPTHVHAQLHFFKF